MGRLIVVSNALPHRIVRNGCGYDIREGAGGLVAAVKTVFGRRPGSVWVGWPGIFREDMENGDVQSLLEGMCSGKAYACVHVVPGREEHEAFYNAFCNSHLWPHLHSMGYKAEHSAISAIEQYQAINWQFAETIARLARPDDTVWVHDYHLLALPRMLRQLDFTGKIGFFSHIPWCEGRLAVNVPFMDEMVQGLLGANLISWQTQTDLYHFLETVRLMGGSGNWDDQDGATLTLNGAQTVCGVFPIGIEPGRDPDHGWVNKWQQDLGTDMIILAVDRLDYTKMVPCHLRAFNRFLNDHPQWCGKVKLLQMLDISRLGILAYQEELRDIQSAASEVNRFFPNHVQVIEKRLCWEATTAAYRAANVALVTPYRDGMNLVAKEAIRFGRSDGVLILSRDAGAFQQLGSYAVAVDPTETSIAHGIYQALSMPKPERIQRMCAMKENVLQYDVHWWADLFLSRLQDC